MRWSVIPSVQKPSRALGTSGNRRDPSSSRAPFPYPVGNLCESALAGPWKADETTLILNGEPVPSKITGYYVDPAIKTVALPDLKPGENVLELEMPYYNKFNVEALYLLGNFGVRTAGQTAVITEPVTRLTFGDICSQGLPFYGGNLTYQVPITVDKPCALRSKLPSSAARLSRLLWMARTKDGSLSRPTALPSMR